MSRSPSPSRSARARSGCPSRRSRCRSRRSRPGRAEGVADVAPDRDGAAAVAGDHVAERRRRPGRRRPRRGWRRPAVAHGAAVPRARRRAPVVPPGDDPVGAVAGDQVYPAVMVQVGGGERVDGGRDVVDRCWTAQAPPAKGVVSLRQTCDTAGAHRSGRGDVEPAVVVQVGQRQAVDASPAAVPMVFLVPAQAAGNWSSLLPGRDACRRTRRSPGRRGRRCPGRRRPGHRRCRRP